MRRLRLRGGLDLPKTGQEARRALLHDDMGLWGYYNLGTHEARGVPDSGYIEIPSSYLYLSVRTHVAKGAMAKTSPRRQREAGARTNGRRGV